MVRFCNPKGLREFRARKSNQCPRAVFLRARSSAFPLGLPRVIQSTGKDRSTVLVANTIVENTVAMMTGLMDRGVAVSIENPHNSV